jgi:gluconolactonase
MNQHLGDIIESPVPQLIATGFRFTEGPLWGGGFLFVSDVADRVQYRVDLRSSSRETIRAESRGANGSTFDLDGRLVTVEQDGRRVVRMESDGSLTVLAERFHGKRLNRCNDIVTHSSGDFYFTDPDTYLNEADKEIGSSAVLRLATDGDLQLLARDVPHPNGLAFSPDEKLLYVSNTRPDPYLKVYDVSNDGTLANGRIFAEMPYLPSAPGATFVTDEGRTRPGSEKGGVPDGLKVDSEGRIFSTGPGGIWAWEADGSFIGLVTLPELPANLAWGDEDWRGMYVAARTSIYRLRVRTPGARPAYGLA